MKALVFNNGVEKTEVNFEAHNGHFSFSSTTMEYVELTKEAMLDICTDNVMNLYDINSFSDNPNCTFNDFVEQELEEFECNIDVEDYEETETGCTYWGLMSAGQAQDNVPTELVELWDTYHLKKVTDENKHIVDVVETLLAELEANVCEQ